MIIPDKQFAALQQFRNTLPDHDTVLQTPPAAKDIKQSQFPAQTFEFSPIASDCLDAMFAARDELCSLENADDTAAVQELKNIWYKNARTLLAHERRIGTCAVYQILDEVGLPHSEQYLAYSGGDRELANVAEHLRQYHRLPILGL